jgi:hypothetical protein
VVRRGVDPGLVAGVGETVGLPVGAAVGPVLTGWVFRVVTAGSVRGGSP